MKVLLFALVSSLIFNSPAWCQVHPNASDVPSASNAEGEVFGGFSLAGGGAPQAGGATGAEYGFNGGADVRLMPHIFLVADVSQFSHPTQSVDTTSDTAFLFGPRYLISLHRNARVSVFGEFLAGGDTYHNNGQAYTFDYNSATTFAFAVQGGADYALSRHLSTRFEGGYLHTNLQYSTYGGPPNPATAANNRGRFAVDFVYRF